jgi:hypothetical protein
MWPCGMVAVSCYACCFLTACVGRVDQLELSNLSVLEIAIDLPCELSKGFVSWPT